MKFSIMAFLLLSSLSVFAEKNDGVFSKLSGLMDKYQDQYLNIKVGDTSVYRTEEIELVDGVEVHRREDVTKSIIIKIDGDEMYSYSSVIKNNKIVASSVFKRKVGVPFSLAGGNENWIKEIQESEGEVVIKTSMPKEVYDGVKDSVGEMKVNLKSPLLCEKSFNKKAFRKENSVSIYRYVSQCENLSTDEVRTLDLSNVTYCDDSKISRECWQSKNMNHLLN